MSDQIITNLEKRIHNLEVAILALSGLSQDTLPPAYSDDMHGVSEDLFNHSRELGGFKESVLMRGINDD